MEVSKNTAPDFYFFIYFDITCIFLMSDEAACNNLLTMLGRSCICLLLLMMMMQSLKRSSSYACNDNDKMKGWLGSLWNLSSPHPSVTWFGFTNQHDVLFSVTFNCLIPIQTKSLTTWIFTYQSVYELFYWPFHYIISLFVPFRYPLYWKKPAFIRGF